MSFLLLLFLDLALLFCLFVVSSCIVLILRVALKISSQQINK